MESQKVLPRWYPWMVATGAMIAFGVRWLHYLYPFTSTYIAKDLNEPLYIVALMMSANSVALVLGGFILGWMTDRWGVRIPLTIAALITGLFTLLTAFAPNIWFAVLTFGIAGLLSWMASAFPKITRTWFPPTLYSTATAYMFLLFRIAPVVLGPMITAMVLTYGWRMAYLYMGIVCTLLAIPAYALLRDKLPPGTKLPWEVAPPAPPRKINWGEAFRYRITWIFFAAASAAYIAPAMVLAYLIPFFRTDYGMDPMTASYLWSSYTLSWLIGVYIMLPLSDLLYRRRIMSRSTFTAILLAVTGILWFVIIGLPGGLPFIIYVIVFFFQAITDRYIELLPALVAEHVSAEIAGMIGAIAGAIAQWPLAAFPPIIGYFIKESFKLAFIVAGIATLLSASIVYLGFRKMEKK